MPTELHRIRTIFPTLAHLKLTGPTLPNHVDVLPRLLLVLGMDSIQELEILHSGHTAMDSRTYRALAYTFVQVLVGYTPVIESLTVVLSV